MRERVSVIRGNEPMILVCPHGSDDINTALIAEIAARELGCAAIINRGFERGPIVDESNDIADCNRVDHVLEDIVMDEYFLPIVRAKDNITTRIGTYASNLDFVNILHIHGCGNAVHHSAGEEVGVIVGYGLGVQHHSYSCNEFQKDAFLEGWYRQGHGKPYQGKGGGKFAGRDRNNMNQYFRKHTNISYVVSMQLEFPFSLRRTEELAIETGKYLARAIEYYWMQNDSYTPSIHMKHL